MSSVIVSEIQEIEAGDAWLTRLEREPSIELEWFQWFTDKAWWLTGSFFGEAPEIDKRQGLLP